MGSLYMCKYDNSDKMKPLLIGRYKSSRPFIILNYKKNHIYLLTDQQYYRK